MQNSAKGQILLSNQPDSRPTREPDQQGENGTTIQTVTKSRQPQSKPPATSQQRSRGRRRRDLGGMAESLALEHLRECGLHVLEVNVHCGRMGELDIVARDSEFLVFVEVKSRHSTAFGSAEQSISLSKRRRLRRLALFYLHTRNLHSSRCRFDVVAINYIGGSPRISHIVNAFM